MGIARTIGRMLRGRRAGGAKLAWNLPQYQGPQTIVLTSPAFEHGQPMPRRHAGKGVGDDVAPELRWTGVPAGAASLLLLLEDPDVPLRKPILHTRVANLPLPAAGDASGSGVLPEGAWNPGERYGQDAASFGRTGYAGPRPIPGHGPHNYVFQLYALDASGAVIARGRLDGTYEQH